MPGGDREGGGLEVKSAYKAKANLTADRQDTGGSRGGPFQMRSGNSPMFKHMGSSPMDFKYAGKDYKNIGEYIKTIQGVTGSGDVTDKAARKAQLKADFSKTKVGQVVKKIGSFFKK